MLSMTSDEMIIVLFKLDLSFCYGVYYGYKFAELSKFNKRIYT